MFCNMVFYCTFTIHNQNQIKCKSTFQPTLPNSFPESKSQNQKPRNAIVVKPTP
jgi:hypothetical protein